MYLKWSTAGRKLRVSVAPSSNEEVVIGKRILRWNRTALF